MASHNYCQGAKPVWLLSLLYFHICIGAYLGGGLESVLHLLLLFFIMASVNNLIIWRPNSIKLCV